MINFTEKYQSLELVSKDKSKLTYTATNIETNEKVILKLYEKTQYKENQFDDLKKIVQFSNINENENLLKINNVDSSSYMDTIYYIVEMEYTEGETLEKILGHKDFNENEGLEIIKQIINGLHDLHRLNIVYKNLSTEKIYVNKDKTLKLDPTGYLDKYTQTIKYISPEQVANKQINKTSDIYSLGVILFEIINKKLPFVWENGKKELYKSMTEEFYIDKDKCSLNVISILENCLYVDEKDRYENLDAFLLDISSHLDFKIRTFRNDIELEKQAKQRIIEAKLKAMANIEESKNVEIDNNNKEDKHLEENNEIKENNNIESNEIKNEEEYEEIKEVKNLKTESTVKEKDRSKYKEYMKIVSACAAVGIVSATLKFAGSDIIEGLKNKDNEPNTTISNQNKSTGYTNKTRDKVNQENTNATQDNNTNTKTNTDNSEYTYKKYNPIEIEDVEIDNTLNTDNEQNKNEEDTNTSQPSQDNNNTDNNTQQKPEQKPEVTPTPEQTPQQPEQKPEETPTPEQTPQQPEQKPEETPTPEQTPQQPEQTPEQTPNTPTDQSPIQEPQTTPEVTPQ